MTTYVIYRHGSNKANQSMCNKAPVAVLEAPSRKAAIEQAFELKNSGRFTVYNNQFLSAASRSQVPTDEFNAACEEDAANAEHEKFLTSLTK